MDYVRLAKDWRTWLLLLSLAFALFALAPTGADDGYTSLSYGLELEGGTTLQLAPVGSTAEVNGLDQDQVSELQTEIVDSLDVPVSITPVESGVEEGIDGEIEIRGNVSEQQIREALEQQDLEVVSLEQSLSRETLTDLRDSIELRLEERLGAGAGASVAVQSNVLTGDSFVVVEVPGERDEDDRLAEIIRQEGRFEIHGTVDPDTNETRLIGRGDGVIQGSVSQPIEDDDRGDGTYYVSFRMDDQTTQEFMDVMVETGGASTDTTTRRDHPPVMFFDGERVFNGSLQPTLATSVREGTWDGGLRVTGMSRDQAQLVSVALRAGELPAPVNIVSTQTISPLRGDQFKQYSLVVALLAVLGVGAAIYNRYRDARIAVPTVLTGVAEVVILLGFSSAMNFNVDLAFIAGMIAVIGTGVDDLIIIADEVQERGRVQSAEIYRKRLKRAFIIIGMAATTTIGAMLPLAWVGLGRISSFAVVTIVGVLIGVLITRPAYGSVLRELITER